MKFIEILTSGMKKALTKQTEQELGERSEYIGASDLNSCVRRAVMDKNHSKKIDLQTGIYFMRGHLAEQITSSALDAEQIPYTYQMELIHPQYPHMKAHLDFIFESSKRVHILEHKTGKLRYSADEWLNQLNMQMGLAKLKWPEKQITLSVLDIDLTAGTVKYFDGFEYDEEEFAKTVDRANLMWDVLSNGTADDNCEKNQYCAWCDHIDGCPAFSGEGLPEIDDLIPTVEDYLVAKQTFKQVETSFEELKSKLLDTAKGFGRKIKVGENTVRSSNRKRAGGIDNKRLTQDMPDVAAAYSKPDTHFSVLDVSPVTKKKKAKKKAKKAA